LVHGFPLNRATWSRQVEAFKGRYRVIAPDLRGFGDSDATAGPVSMSRFAADLHALLQHLGTGPVIIAGHSMGGYVALAFAKAHGEALRALVLVGTKAGADTPEGAAARRATAQKVRAEDFSVVVESMAPKMLSAGNRDAAMATSVRGFMAAAKPEGIVGALLGMAERPDAGPWLGQIRVPTLVITGADDILIPPSESAALATAIPGSQAHSWGGPPVAFERAGPTGAGVG
jgi:pimeloyl-ACP methyl ester carboxylesterase